MSEHGLAVLKRFQGSARDCPRMRLIAREPCLLRMLDAVGLTRAIGTYPSVNAALSSESVHSRVGWQTNLSNKKERTLSATVIST